jgi:polyhydroxyalkanoate synthase
MWVEASKRFTEMGQEYMKQMTGFWTAAMGGANPWAGVCSPQRRRRDKRFSGEAWTSDPRFDAIKRTYLAYWRFPQQVGRGGAGRRAHQGSDALRVRQIVDAHESCQFPRDESRSDAACRRNRRAEHRPGHGSLFNDLAAKRITITDVARFEVGKNLAATPGSVVFENDLIQLIQYAPTTAKVHEVRS